MLRARKHKKVSTAKVSNQKPEAEFCQHPTASHVARQVPCEPKHPLPKRIWKPKQESSAETSGVATPKPRLSYEEKGKMPARADNAANHKVQTAIIPSPRAAKPSASLAVISKAIVPQRTHQVYSREARARAQFCADLIRRNKEDRVSPCAHPEKISTRDCSGPYRANLRRSLPDKRRSEPLRITSSCCQRSGCRLVMIHSIRCRSRPILVTPPCRRSVFDRLSAHIPMKHLKRSASPDPVSASVNMTGRGPEPRRGSQASDNTCGSPDPDYSPGLGEILVQEEGVF